jgi:hypothetical protein
MKEVYKVCFETGEENVFRSIFHHASSKTYKIGKKSSVRNGFLYAFKSLEDAEYWVYNVILSENGNDFSKSFLDQDFDLFIILGKCTRIAGRYHQTITHLPSDQLNKKMLQEFWGINVTDRSSLIRELPEPKGAILIPDFIAEMPVSGVHRTNLSPYVYGELPIGGINCQ